MRDKIEELEDEIKSLKEKDVFIINTLMGLILLLEVMIKPK